MMSCCACLAAGEGGGEVGGLEMTCLPWLQFNTSPVFLKVGAVADFFIFFIFFFKDGDGLIQNELRAVMSFEVLAPV